MTHGNDQLSTSDPIVRHLVRGPQDRGSRTRRAAIPQSTLAR
jgi:hypothetical protein